MITHVVRPGETMRDIAWRYGISVDALWAANRWIGPGGLRPGMRIQIPRRWDRRRDRWWDRDRWRDRWGDRDRWRGDWRGE